ncbi:MAG: hypothetical protein JRH20_11760 [Deltaproteobacteria bacterium]|nr:hypothetical protein [Deltaproteobacteria bacterium]
MAEPSWPTKRTTLGLFALFLLLTLISQGASLQGEFLFDDIPTLVENDCHRGFDKIPQLFRLDANNVCTGRPLRYISFMLDHALWGERTVGYHLHNLVLHATCALLLLLLVSQLTRRHFTHHRHLALLSALIFLLHPITTEAVSYISGRRDLLMAFFSLLAVLCYLRQSRWSLLLSPLLLLCALLSHESAIMLPVVLLFAEGVMNRGEIKDSLRAVSLRLAPLFTVSAAFGLFTLLARNSSTRTELWGANVGAHLGTVARVHWRYLEQIFYPVEQQADYSPRAFELSTAISEPRSALALLALLLLLGVASWWLLKKRHALAALVLGYFALLFPSSHLLAVHHELAAEHRLYLPLALLSPLIGAALLWGLQKLASVRLRGTLVLAFLGTLGMLTAFRSSDWVSNEALWRTTVTQAPNCARARTNLGAVYARQGRFYLAQSHLMLAAALRPDFCAAHLNLGHVQLDLGFRKAGVATLKRALRCQQTPSYFRALAKAQLRVGQLAAAARTLELARRAYPSRFRGKGP